MTQDNKPAIGTIGWFDLTVENADEVRDFYAEVVGWKVEDTPMGDYSDYTMKTPADGSPTAGVCHARGSNAGLPPQWLLYVTVDNLERSMQAARDRGGEVAYGPRSLGSYGEMCVVRDPAGAVMALMQPPT